MTSTLAMLFLVLFTTLSLAFYANLGTSMQTAYNDLDNVRARYAAESGMEFIRYQLASLNISHNTPPDQLFTTVYEKLADAMDGTYNLSGGDIAVSGETILIPGSSSTWVSSDNQGSQFRATVERVGQKLRVQVTGRNGTTVALNRSIQLDYGLAQRASAIFDYGVASKSAVALNGNVSIRGTAGNEARGSVLSTTMTNPVPVSMTGSAEISGDVSVTNPNPNSISVGNSSTIAGLSPSDPEFDKHIHAGIEAPEFPTVDTSIFAPYATNVVMGSTGGNLKNIRIKAGTNPSFAGGSVLQGVIYVEYPNRVRFSGGVTIQGVLVVETNEQANADLDPTANVLEFAGGVTAKPLSTLPDTADFPASLRQLSGAFVLAPGFTTKFKGNFGTVSGSIIASQIEFSGTAGGTVSGSVINLNDTALTLSGTSDIIIQSQGTSDYPAGVFFGSRYTPLPDTYAEIKL